MRCPIGNRNAEAHGYEKRGDVQNCEAEFRVAMKLGQRRVRIETPEGRLLNLIETAKAHFHAKVSHPFRIINDQFGFRKVFIEASAHRTRRASVAKQLEQSQTEVALCPGKPLHGMETNT